ncbi:MAG: hypothetical protein WDN26_17725 [Chitinophagaceae bacterium]
MSYAFAEDFLTLALRAIPGSNEIAVKDFITRQILNQNLTVDVLNFLQLIEGQKKNYKNLQTISLNSFAELAEQSQSTERTIGNLYKDRSTLLQYAEAILKERNIRWDDEVTGIIGKATDILVHCIIASIKDVMTKDIKSVSKSSCLVGVLFILMTCA